MFMNKSNFKICVLGLGYVGLPLAIAFGKKFNTFGYDIDKKKIGQLKNHYDSNLEVQKKEFLSSKKLIFSDNLDDFKKCNIFILTLPTPINSNNLPNLNILKNGIEKISNIIKPNDTIVIESTVYPGVTENICGKLIEEKTKLKLNKDFFLGYSPERINPGDKKIKLENTDKIISASNQKTLNKLNFLYTKIIKAKIIKVKNIKIAESAKVIENTQRDVNIALINELSILFDKLKIDSSEVLKAASTKWNFHKYEPGLVGGHCIGVDPYYLTYVAKKNKFNPNIILAGRKINDNMHKYIYDKLITFSHKKKINPKTSKILFIGLTFKENCNDLRNSKSLELLKLIVKNFKNVSIFDPLITLEEFNEIKYFQNLNDKSFVNEEKIKKIKYDIVILSVPHKKVLFFLKRNIKNILKKKKIIFDIKNKIKMKNLNIDFCL